MKKIFITVVLFLLFSTSSLFAATNEKPVINCVGLPGCQSGRDDPTGNIAQNAIASIIAHGIQYIAVLAVLSLMISGIMYLISGGEEEKTNKAKKAIIWSLVGVFLSISAWLIIDLINTFQIN